ncbi:MAG: hypothetical protein AAGE76_10575 [Pseudomonadota bacterium]
MLLDLVRFGHVIGISLGFGLAIYADRRFLRSLAVPITAEEIETMRAIHRHVMVAMGLLWVTGALLLYHRTGFAAAAFAPKLIFKIAIVTVLTANAFVIGHWAVPHFQRHIGAAFVEFPLRLRLKLSLVGGLSAGCWLSLLALGVFQGFKTMPAGQIADILQWTMALPLIGAALLGLFAPLHPDTPRAGDRGRMRPIRA